LAQWLIVEADIYEDEIIPATFEQPPKIDKEQPWTFHLLMSDSVASFSIQWAYWDENRNDDWELRWFPSDDPDENGHPIDSHFDLMGIKHTEINQKFGCMFNIPDNQQIWLPDPEMMWLPTDELHYNYIRHTETFDRRFFPVALKFTFRLYDSKGVIEGGREFTHIVYLED
jgi:hypothetical protein